ncbi:hypothetical protein FA95DRAFT_1454578, partial [Auriscalpium vulgare]
AVIRACLMGMMRISDTACLPDPIPAETIPGVGDDEEKTVTTRILRPRWDLDWKANSRAWFPEVEDKIRQHGHRWSKDMSADALKSVPSKTYRDMIHTTISTWKTAYKTQQKGAGEKEAANRVKRLKGRQTTKATLRKQHRHQVKALQGSEYEWLDEVSYQSIDESGGEEDERAIDPQSAEDVETRASPPRKGKKRKMESTAPYITRAPAYR